MNFTFYGHACFSVEVAEKKLLFDPFITPNELAKNININYIQADYILISHGHADHIADAVQLALHTGACVVCSWEVYEWLTKQGLTNMRPMNTGGRWQHDWGSIKCTVAQHSSGLPDGTYGGNPMGFIIETKDGSFYYSGDTALTLDMKLIGEHHKIDCAIMPVGDNFTMGYEDALIASDFVNCNNIIGVHFDTFGYIVIDHAQATSAFEHKGKTLRLPVIGETILM